MKITAKRPIRDEKGQALIMVLILLVVGLLITTPLLAYMGTGLIAGGVYERRMAELYAADAGVEDAMWKIQNQVDELPVPSCEDPNPYWSYNISDVNGKSLEVTITCVNNTTYQVISTATGDGRGTEIEAYITGESVFGDYSGITDRIITSQGEIDVKNKVNLSYPEGHGPVDYYDGPWPTPEELGQFYWQDVEDATHYGSDTTIDLNGVDLDLEPLSINGTLDILNSSNTPATLTLNGTVYITGDTLIGQNGKDFTLDLNGQTIFVESSSADAIIVGGKCIISGPGAIIAVGNIYFAPKGDVGGNGEPVFILSVSGTTLLQPSGDLYGAIAGSVEVEVKQGTSPTITYPEAGFGDDLNFLTGVQQLIYSIASWEVNPL
jgi:hypothetical protein